MHGDHELRRVSYEPDAGMLMTSPGMITTDELAQLLADSKPASDTQNLRRMVNTESPDCTV